MPRRTACSSALVPIGPGREGVHQVRPERVQRLVELVAAPGPAEPADAHGVVRRRAGAGGEDPDLVAGRHEPVRHLPHRPRGPREPRVERLRHQGDPPRPVAVHGHERGAAQPTYR